MAETLPDGSNPDSLAGVMGPWGDSGGIEAEVSLGRLRHEMFDVGATEVRRGRYRHLEEIGRGGMGVVYRAHDEALDRDVAIKVLRSGTGGPSHRLQREAQAMARLSHPNVVQVLEVGHEGGEAFVVMEMVAGRDGSAWLDERRQPWRAVLEVFIAAGRGLAAAHQQGLVHRDFKPSNLMVRDDGRVQVTDFGLVGIEPGVASDAGPSAGPVSDAGDDALGWATATGGRIGTPRYMAPEQRHGGPVGPAADQWAFAVSLWEALHARHPFAHDDGTLDGERLTPSRPASTDVPRVLRRVLQRALKPEADQRYGSMLDLLDRLEAAAYGRRTARRLGLVGVGVGVIALAWASATSSPAHCDPTGHSSAVWSEARRNALQAAFVSTGVPYADRAWTDVRVRVDPWMVAWNREYRRMCEARAVASTKADADAELACMRGELAELDALFDVLAQADRDVLAEADRALEDLPAPRRCVAVGTTFDVEPVMLAAHAERMARARAQSRAARHERAAVLAETAASEVSEHGVLHREALLLQGRALFAADALDESARVLSRAFYDGAAAEDSKIAGQAAVGLLDLAVRRSDVDAAEDWERHAQTWGERVVDAEVRRTLERDRAMAEASRRSHEGEYDAALVLLERARELDAGDPASPYAARLLNQVGMIHIERSAYPQAAQALEEAAALELRRVGPNHPRYANALSNVGTVHWYQADLDGAERAYRQTYRIRLAAFGPDHYKTGVAIMNLGLVADLRGEYDEAVPLLERAVAALTAAHGREHPDTALAINNLAVTLSKMGQRERSNAAYREALEIYTLALGPEHPRVATVMGNLATGLAEASRYPEALELHAKALPIVERVHGRVHAHYANGLHNIAVIRRTLGDHREAEAHDREVLAIFEELLGPEHPQLARVLVGLSRDALDDGRVQEAIALALRARRLKPTDKGVRGLAAFCLAQAYEADGRSGTSEFVELLDEAQRDLERADAASQLRQLLEFRAATLP